MDEIYQPEQSSSTLNELPTILPSNNGTSSNDEEEDNNSDLDMDIVQLSRRSCSKNCAQSSEANSQPSEITLADDSDHQDDITEDTGQNSSHYGLRRRRSVISYKDLVQSSDDDEGAVNNLPSTSKKSRKSSKFRDVLDVCSLLHNTSTKQLNKFIKNPEIIENLSVWNITMSLLHTNDFHDELHLELFQKFVQKCARHVNHLVLICDDINRPPRCWSKVLKLLTNVFKHATFLKQFSMRYHREESNSDQVIQVLNVIGESGQKSLNSLKLLCLAREGEEEKAVITKEELDVVVKLAEAGGGISWVDIELGDGLLVTQDYEILTTLERLLEVGKDSLESVTIHGGLKGRPGLDKSKLSITFPRKMSSLRELTVCPKYNFVSDSMDTKNPSSKRWREIRLDDDSHLGGHDELSPLKLILVLGHTDFPVLEKVVLGNLIELEECGFSLLRKLKIFRCGSRWDLAVRFPQNASKKGSSQLKEMQLPDGLKDPSFVQKVGKFFPLLRKVWIYLPSVPVLRTFFKSYENSSALEELYIKTQFDFETTLESCLLPGSRDERNSLSDSSKTVLRTLKEYKHFGDYARYYNIELPLEDEEDLSELRRNSAGIQALKSLQVLDLEHIPRTLLIPNPEDERRWYDHNFKYLNTTFGFRLYPYSRRCHQEILGLNLREYHWRNLDFLSSRSHFDKAGYVAMDYVDLMSSSGEDDLFIPISTKSMSRNKSLTKSKSTSRGIKVAIKPSMLVPDHWKSKTET